MSEQAITLPREQNAPSPLPAVEKSHPPGKKPKTPAEARIRELLAGRKILERENAELREDADQANRLRTELLVALQEIDSLKERLQVASENAVAQAEAEESQKKQAQADAERRRHEAWKLLIARSRPLAAKSNFDEAMAKSDRFFSTALLEQILQFELSPQITFHLALKPELCQQLSQSSLVSSALALVRIEAEIQQEILKENAQQTFVRAANRGGW